jgi:hypothetical protein
MKPVDGFVEPAIGLEPMTCALRVRIMEISQDPPSPLSLRIPEVSRLLRRNGIAKTPAGGECTQRCPNAMAALNSAHGSQYRKTQYTAASNRSDRHGGLRRMRAPLLDSATCLRSL